MVNNLFLFTMLIKSKCLIYQQFLKSFIFINPNTVTVKYFHSVTGCVSLSEIHMTTLNLDTLLTDYFADFNTDDIYA